VAGQEVEHVCISVVDAIIEAGWAKSKGEAKRLIRQGAVAVQDGEMIVTSKGTYLCLHDGGIIVRCGKRNVARFVA
jgi:tyrosyl-tRNA synthetase